ncbi:DUF2470 domain-containing protein [Phytohabitans rumicis]|uniref:DUF2470 domain-containing protein n=1 Tax=Phytohabitans rumicis TaxID=1076125 RepID=A0A6V8KWS4_9ACTN|nr:DUF2470 domain-containing protein [Phytohabitans rumicis]GFJ88304.1 hypothetical protein Prum_019460 [Phytohabitans rumicis]
MHPSPAEVARTLAAGRLRGSAHIACRPGPHQVRHATDAGGRVLLLVPVDSDIARALRPADDAEDVALVLDVLDVPPVAGAPSLGRVWVSGWAAPLAGTEARQAALDFVDIDPTGDLLDVGRGQVIFRMAAEEVRLERGGALIDIDPDEYAAAEPDPLHAIEWDLLTDLADHHVPEMADYIHRQLTEAGHTQPPGAQPRVVRLDRYGFVVALGTPGREYRARLAFPRPVADRADLARLLHPVLCRHCGVAAA